MSEIQINGFADIHTHILPGVDDGAKDMPEALDLVRMAWEDGTRTLVLTPHYRGVYKENTPAYLREIFGMFCQMIEEACPGMKLYLGNEIYYETEAPDRLAEGKILPLCDSQYALLEFSGKSTRSQVLAGVSETIRCGFIPIIAHAERYDVFLTNRTLPEDVLDMGALIQLNADSVMGGNGSRVKRFCHNLLKTQSVHFIASDAHSPTRRPPLLRECFLRVSRKYGEEYAARVFCDHAQAVIENRVI